VGLGCVGGDGPCAAVNEEDGIADGGCWHGVMVPQAPAVRRRRLAPLEGDWRSQASPVRQPRLTPPFGK
jgi:hypothetical protein